MDDLLVSLLLAVFVLIVITSLQYYRQRWPISNFPPGPTGLPILGTVLSTGSEKFFRRTVRRFKPHYGNVFSLMLDKPLVAVSGYKAISEVIQTNKGYDFASRIGSLYSILKWNPDLNGIFFANFTETFQKHQRFVLSSLRGFGFGKASFEGIINREVEGLLDHIKSLPKAPHDLAMPLMTSICSVLCETFLGCHYDHNDTDFQRLMCVMDALVKKAGETEVVMMDFIPITRLFFQHKVREIQAIADEFHTFTLSRVADRRKNYVAGKAPQDFLDCYLEKMIEEPETYSMRELRFVLADLFVAATDTTANTLNYVMLFMIANPDVQEKVYQELMEVVGPSRLPSLGDRNKLPYTVATIYESQRLANVSPGLPRCTIVDTTLAGYSIPRGTRVMCDIWGLHIDPELWPEPERFEPTRHIDDNGKVTKSPYLMPFGGGRRVCMGESFAKMELFLFFSSLIHQFKFAQPPGVASPSLHPQPGLIHSPQTFQVIITERANEFE